jgi:hypothetical protein
MYFGEVSAFSCKVLATDIVWRKALIVLIIFIWLPLLAQALLIPG